MKDYFKYLVWHGQVTKVKCTNHSYSWTGSMPNTGSLCCLHCGKESWETVSRQTQNKKMLDLLQGHI